MEIGKTLKSFSFSGAFCAAVSCKPSKLRLVEPFHWLVTDKRPTDEQSESVLELVFRFFGISVQNVSECKHREELVKIDRNNRNGKIQTKFSGWLPTGHLTLKFNLYGTISTMFADQAFASL